METIINESSFANPLTIYGWSKLYCEKLLENWSKENNIILRIGHIYGKGEKVIPVTILRFLVMKKEVSNLIMKSILLQKYEGVINSYAVKNIVETEE